ncbi:MAG: hypothetical protein HC915_17220, partial [Anaerolineae bacterium]|nr:hypothetical protein [Anaerolineae bacterium]
MADAQGAVHQISQAGERRDFGRLAPGQPPLVVLDEAGQPVLLPLPADASPLSSPLQLARVAAGIHQ